MVFCIVFPAPGAGKNLELPKDMGAPKTQARVVARIQHSVTLQAGKALSDKQFQISKVRERQCLSGDMPDEAKCRFIVTDVE